MLLACGRFKDFTLCQPESYRNPEGLQSPAFRYPAASASAAVLKATRFFSLVAAAPRQFGVWWRWLRRFPTT